jgi:ABC-type Na+ efflux pump permease subunit
VNWRAIRAIVRRDLQTVLRSKGVLIPLIIVPALLMVLMPGLFAYFAPALSELPGGESDLEDVALFLEGLPAGLREALGGYDEIQTMIYVVLVYFFAPMFLILPVMVSSVIAADSFAGEKERKTLEALIYTPTTDLELFAGKLLSAWLPALAVTLLGFVLYGVTVNAAAWPTMGELFFPTPMWFVVVLWVAPAAAGASLATTVLVSSRVSTFQEAYQLGALMVLPVMALLLGQATGLMYFSVGLAFGVGLVFWLVTALLLWVGVGTFRRSEIIARL